MTFFLVINSETEKTTTRSILSHQKALAFQQKTLQNMYFSGKSDKTLAFLKNPRKNPRSPRKIPRSLDRVGKPQIWGENPRSGNADAIPAGTLLVHFRPKRTAQGGFRESPSPERNQSPNETRAAAQSKTMKILN